MRYCLNYSGTLGFCPLKVEITQFPDGFCLDTTWISNGTDFSNRFSFVELAFRKGTKVAHKKQLKISDSPRILQIEPDVILETTDK